MFYSSWLCNEKITEPASSTSSNYYHNRPSVGNYLLLKPYKTTFTAAYIKVYAADKKEYELDRIILLQALVVVAVMVPVPQQVAVVVARLLLRNIHSQ